MRSWTFVVALVGLVALAVPAAAQVYKWTDERGVVHFGNQPPPNVEAETVQPGPSRAAERAAESEPQAGSAGESAATSPAVPREGPYAGLSDDAFSSVVTRERGRMRRELAQAKRELAEATAALEEERDRKAEPTPALELDRIIGRATGIGDGPPADREKELEGRKDMALKKIETIQQSFGELEREATARYGSLPGWWMPLER